MKHLKDTISLSRDYLENDVFPACDVLRGENTNTNQLEGKTLFSLFYEPSFLTRISFERAITLLGGHPLHTEDASQFFPVTTTNYIEDTVSILKSLHIDAVVLRTSEANVIDRACEASDLPIINGGSSNDHPTQSMADLYTINRELGGVDGITITVIGRLEHRNVSALLLGLSLFKDIQVRLLPISGQISPNVDQFCREKGLKLTIISELDEISSSSVVYLNGPRTIAHYQMLQSRAPLLTKIDASFMSRLNKDSIVLDPMQRSGDFSIEVQDPRLAFYRQSENALYVRMSVLSKLLL